MYGVFLKGDYGVNDKKPIKIFENLQEAEEYAIRCNNILSPFEKIYAYMEYYVKEIK